jgi:hypothetical protein
MKMRNCLAYRAVRVLTGAITNTDSAPAEPFRMNGVVTAVPPFSQLAATRAANLPPRQRRFPASTAAT